MDIQTKSLTETKNAAQLFLNEVAVPHKSDKALVVGLSGDLGSGKTAFTKEVASLLGIENTVTSPTFVLERIYKIPEEGILSKKFKHLIHIDAYRLQGGEELKGLGWEEITQDPRNIIFIEWPEQVNEVLPKSMVKIQFKFIDETTRRIGWGIVNSNW